MSKPTPPRRRILQPGTPRDAATFTRHGEALPPGDFGPLAAQEVLQYLLGELGTRAASPSRPPLPPRPLQCVWCGLLQSLARMPTRSARCPPAWSRPCGCLKTFGEVPRRPPPTSPSPLMPPCCACRQFVTDLNALTTVLLPVCSAATCPTMNATDEWQYLCAAHRTPREVSTV